MDTKAKWIKDLEKREEELILLRKEQIAREGAVYQREELLKINEEILKQRYEALEKQKALNQACYNAQVAEAEALGVIKGRAEERNKTETLLRKLDVIKDGDISLLKDLLEKALAALQISAKIERK